MKIIKIIFKYLYLLFFLIYFYTIINYKIFHYKLIFKNIYYNKNEDKKLLIEIDVSSNKGGRGPTKFINGINEILPFTINNCHFISSSIITPINSKNKSDFFYIPFPRFNESVYNEWVKIKEVNKLILGPIFVPHIWKSFPNLNIWKERRFSDIINFVSGIGVHSNRVKDYLAQKSNTTNMIKKYKIIRPCSNIKPKYINSFNDRKIDILFFEKYQDFDHKRQGSQLLKLFKNSTKKIKQIKYGFYNKEKIEKMANNSKFIVYFSFYDTGAIGLKEIQNYGVFAFSHQLDLVIDNTTSFFVPELANNNNMLYAYKKIMQKIETIIKSHPNSKLIAKKNQEINKCENALEDLCKSLTIK